MITLLRPVLMVCLCPSPGVAANAQESAPMS